MESLNAPSAACEVNLQVWDTPGQEVYRSLVKLYYRNVQGVVLVVSLDDTADGLAKQLGSLDYWLEQMSQTIASEQNLAFILIANKADTLLTQSEKGRFEHEAVIKQWCESKASAFGSRIPYYRASARTGSGVDEAFQGLCRQILLNLATQQERISESTCCSCSQSRGSRLRSQF